MRPVLHAFSVLAVLLSLNACRNTPGTQATNVGPFDKDGNYVDAWADTPSKWRPYTPKGAEGGGELPHIATTDQPPPNSVPLAVGSSTTARPTRTALATNSSPPAHDSTHLVTSTSSKHKTGADTNVASTSSKHKTGSDAVVAKTSSKYKTKAAAAGTAKSSSKSKTSVAKIKPKSTSGATRHTVKSGDSLYSIAASHGTTIAALKSANGLSGSVIVDGKVLVIPAHK